MTVAVDFDGVLAEHKGINRHHEFEGLPRVKDSVEALWWLLGRGYDVYILTARGEDEHGEVERWLHENGYPLLEVTNVKKLGTSLIIDDRALRFTNWQDICKYLG